MSKGLGKVERAVLEVFEKDPSGMLDSITLTIRVHGRQATQSQYSATRRALNGLQKKGLVTRLEGSFRFGRSVYALPERAKEYMMSYLRDKVAMCARLR
jgi:DNA-binding IclR family transcriptional regulator